jgi:hypothetical protein
LHAPTAGIVPVAGQASPLFPATKNALRTLPLQAFVDLSSYYNDTFGIVTRPTLYELQDAFLAWITK